MTETLDPGPLQQLIELESSGAQPGTAKRILDAYLADLPVKLEEMHRGAAQQDPNAMALAAHTLKGSSSYVGAGRIEQLCADLEQIASGPDHSAIAEAIDQIGQEMQRYRLRLVDEFPDLTTSR